MDKSLLSGKNEGKSAKKSEEFDKKLFLKRIISTFGSLMGY